MSARRLPPLNALRGFEAAARHLSFTRAAQELHLTQGAVSRQVKELEAYLGHPLFHRLTRRIELTPEGEQFFKAIETALAGIEHAAGHARHRTPMTTLTISALPTLASTWLMPRLHRFTSRSPDVDVRVLTSIEPANLLATDADVAIRVGKLPGRHYNRRQPRIELTMVESWDGVSADELFPDRLVPVCAPGLLADEPWSVEEIAHAPLIHTTTRRHAWPDWLRWHGTRPRRAPDPHLQFGHFFIALDAARAGRGIALVPDILLTDDPQEKGLIVAHASTITSAGAYYLLAHDTRLAKPAIQAFRTWLLDEATRASEPLSAKIV